MRTPSLAPVREKLRTAGAAYVGRVLETNRLFDSADGSLRAGGCGLRVRSVDVLDGRGPSPTLTYKGPRTQGPFKRREEIEVNISDAETTAELLRALGYVQDVVFEKRRESWLLASCRVELDELPRLGTFVEVEGPDEDAIRSVLAALDLATAEPIMRSYVSMVAALGDGSGGGLRNRP